MPEPVNIIVEVEGGVVQAVYSTSQDIAVEVIDRDLDSDDDDNPRVAHHNAMMAKVTAGEYPYELLSGETLENREPGITKLLPTPPP